MLVTMTRGAVLGYVALPAIAFALGYYPAVTYLTRSLVSPYAKADLRKRFYAAAIDGALVTTLGLLYQASESMGFLAAAALYLAFRDAIGGRSLGKLLCGLMVVSVETGRPATTRDSLRRNLVLLLPGANVVAVFLEATTIVRDVQGQRLGDRLAQTQVVEGLDVKELVRAFDEWWRGVVPEITRAARPKPSRGPALPRTGSLSVTRLRERPGASLRWTA
jgi:uncharacterized RDD family membrane protein YckC